MSATIPPPTQTARSRLMVGVLAFCVLIVAVMQTLVIPLLPHVPALTHSTPTAASWLVTVTLLTGCVCTPVFGRIGDMYGKRKIVLTSMCLLTVGSVLCAVSSQIALLIAGRAFQGAALAIVPLGISIMRDELAPERVLRSVALMSSTLGIGATIGLPVTAVVIENFDWHTIFWASAAIGLLDIVLVLRFVPESSIRSHGRFDALGALGLSTALIALLLAVTQGADWGWLSAPTLALLATAVIIGLLWGLYELKAATPVVDLRVSARPAVLLTNIAALLIGFAFYANSLSTGQMVQEPRSTGYGLGASIVVSGLCLLPSGLAMVALSPVSARISAACGPKTTLALASVLLAVGYVVRLFTNRSLGLIIAGSTVVAAGTAIAYSALPALVIRAVPLAETGAANGLNTLMRSIGQACSSAVVAAVLANVTSVVGGRALPTLRAYQTVFLIAGAGAVLALTVTLCLPGRSGPAGETTAQGGGVRATAPAKKNA
ncbi:MFS transporter [Streptomyces sp. NPDC090088]|uniref:MFS transporter n=1 Tax=Streptomyces sp. NPDC090088 TaxID=3365944 RepID=UPI003830FAD9